MNTVVVANEAVEANTPVQVNFSSVSIADGPIYISIQKRDQYLGLKGHGAVLKAETPRNITTAANVAEPVVVLLRGSFIRLR